MSFAWNLKTLRSEAGLTQGELASKVGASQKTISSWETGRTEPTVGDVARLCKALDCTMERLTGTKTHDISDISLDDILVRIRSLSGPELTTLRKEIEDVIHTQERIRQMEEERRKYLAQIAEYEAKINSLRQKINDTK